MCRKNQKLASCQRTSEAASDVAQTKTPSSVKTVAAVSGTTDIQGVTAAPDVSEYLNLELGGTDLGTTDDVRRTILSEEPRVDGTGVSVPGEKPLPHSETDATNVASSVVDSSSSDGIPLEGGPADKVEQLRKLIDRAAGQLYTIAEVYLMMMKPMRVPLEYDWVDTSTGSAATDDVSARLRKLVSVAKAAFTASTAKPLVGNSLNTNGGN